MKRRIDLAKDPKCQSLLRDLEALSKRAGAQSRRLDSEHVAVGTCWGVTRGLAQALDSARRESSPLEES